MTVSPALTVSGSAVLARERFADVPTDVDSTAELFAGLASGLADAMDAVAATVEPSGTLGSTLTVSENDADAPAASTGLVHVTFPVPPGAGAVQLHPGGAETAAKVVPAGVACVTAADRASLGPPLITLMLYVS